MAQRGLSWWAVAGYLLPTFPLGYLWHLTTFKARYEALEIYRPDLAFPLGILSMAVQAVLFAWLYPRLFDTRRENWLRGALGFGVVFGLLAWSFTTLPVAAKFRMTSVADFLWLETGFTALQFAVVSPLIALAYRQRPAV